MTEQFKRLDAKEAIFFSKELEHVKSKTYDTQFPEFKARSLIPVSMEANAGAETISYQTFTEVGMAKVVANYSKDFPRADIKGAEEVSFVKSLGDSYGYSIQDIRAAALAGKPLAQRKANAAKRAVSQLEESIAFYGDAANKLGGLLSNASIPSSTLPADGAGSSTKIEDKTPDQIIRDLNNCANSIVTTTKGVENPNTLILPINVYTYIASTPRSSTSDTTILEFFLKNNPFITQVTWANQMTEPTAGWASVGLSFTGDVMIAYNRNPDKLTLEVPQDFEQFAPELEVMEYKVACHQRTGGVIIYYPLSLNICEGV